MGRQLRRHLLLVATGLFAAQPAKAQDSVRAARDTGAVLLPGVTVTATRTPAPLADVPLAITQISKVQLSDLRGYGFDEAMFGVPGVLAQSRAGGSDIRLVIRGFGARGSGDRSNAGTSRGIRILLDGLPLTEPDGRTSFDLVDIAATQAIEVVRSNASSIWGNAAGGVVNIGTITPYHQFGFDAQATFGSFDLQRYIGKAGTRVGDGSLYGAFVHTNYGGWRQNSTGDRPLLSFGYQGNLGPADHLGVSVVATRNQFEIPGPLTQEQFDTDPQVANPLYLARHERRDNKLARFGAIYGHDFSESGVLSVTGFVTPKKLVRSERGTYRIFDRDQYGGSASYSQKVNFGKNVPATLSGGMDDAYQTGPARFYSLTPEGNQGSELQQDKTEAANSLGLFLQAEIGVGEHLRFLAGVRYDNINYSYTDRINPGLDASKSFDHVTPKLGVAWLVSSGTIYANLGGGSEVPAYNEVDPPGTGGLDTVTGLNPLLEPMTSTTIEVGTRQQLRLGDHPGNFLSLDGALYLTNVDNDLIPYRGGRFYFNAGQTRRKGFEVGAGLTTVAGVSLRGSATFSSNTFVSYTVDSVHYGRPGQVADYSGNQLPGVPSTFYGVEAAWAPAPLRYVRIQLAVQGNDSYFADDANTISVPGYAIFNATLATARPIPLGRGVGINAFVTVNNIGNNTYAASAYINPDVIGGVPVYLEPGLPRNVVVSFSVSR